MIQLILLTDAQEMTLLLRSGGLVKHSPQVQIDEHYPVHFNEFLDDDRAFYWDKWSIKVEHLSGETKA